MAPQGPLQLELPVAPRVAPRWGGRRPGAGRKRKAPRPRVPHRVRPPHARSHPLHITWRCVQGLPSLRGIDTFPAVLAALAAGQRSGFRVLHFSVQDNHVHLIVEASDSRALRAGAHGLAIRFALAVQRATARRGRILEDRHHVRALRTPREVRVALAYVLQNFKKHQVRVHTSLDPCSSAAWCDGIHGFLPEPLVGAPVVAARTWLGSVGWRKHGLLSPSEAPA